MKWKQFDYAALLRLMKPVEGSWEPLARNILNSSLQYKIKSIRDAAFYVNPQAFDSVLDKWQSYAPKAKWTWDALSTIAKQHGDESVEKYIAENDHIESEFYVPIYRRGTYFQ